MLFRTLRIVACLFIAALTLELCARVEDVVTQGAPLLGAYHQNILYDRPGADFRGIPGARYLKWHLNSLGYRGPEPEQGAIRIACVGASETFGLYEKEGGEWPRQMERLLNEGGGPRRYTVINTAYPGANLRTHLHQGPAIIAAAKPDIVVLYTSVSAYVHPDFYGVLKAGTVPEREIRMVTKAKELFRRVIPPAVSARMRAWETQRSLRGREDEVVDRIPPENVALFSADLEKLLDFYASHNLQVVIVTHAHRFGKEVTPEERPILVAWRQAYPTLREDGFLDMEAQLNERLRQAAAARGLVVADAARTVPAGPRYFADYVHLTDDGARELANVAAAAVRRQAEARPKTDGK